MQQVLSNQCRRFSTIWQLYYSIELFPDGGTKESSPALKSPSEKGSQISCLISLMW
jgi:hypothetical protein